MRTYSAVLDALEADSQAAQWTPDYTAIDHFIN